MSLPFQTLQQDTHTRGRQVWIALRVSGHWCDLSGAASKNHPRAGDSIHTDSQRVEATRRRTSSEISVAKLGVLAGPRLSQNQNMFELQVILEFGLLVHRDSSILALGDQFRDSPGGFVRGAESYDGLRCCAGGEEIHNFVV